MGFLDNRDYGSMFRDAWRIPPLLMIWLVMSRKLLAMSHQTLQHVVPSLFIVIDLLQPEVYPRHVAATDVQDRAYIREARHDLVESLGCFFIA